MDYSEWKLRCHLNLIAQHGPPNSMIVSFKSYLDPSVYFYYASDGQITHRREWHYGRNTAANCMLIRMNSI
jgi:hypothetical protein